MSLTALRKLERSLAADGVLDAADMKKLDGAAQDATERRQIYEFVDGFERKGGTVKSDAKTALSAIGKKGTLEPQRELGTLVSPDGTKNKILSTHQVGPEGGYDNKWQALGAAKAFPGTAAIVEEKGKFKVYETPIPPGVGGKLKFEGAKGSKAELVSFEPPTSTQKWGDQVRDAKALYDSYRTGGGATEQQVKDAYKALVSRATGVPEKDVNVCFGPKQHKVGMVNFDFNETANGSVGRYDASGAPQPMPGDRRTAPLPTTLALGPSSLSESSPLRTQRTFIHEATHLAHEQTAEKLLSDWRAAGTKGTFLEWLDKQRKAGKIDAGTLETAFGFTTGVLDDAKDNGNPALNATEHLAYAEAFMATFRYSRGDKGTEDMDRYLGDVDSRKPTYGLVDTTTEERMERFAARLPDADRERFDKLRPKMKRALSELSQ